MKYFVDKEWLSERLDDPSVRIADCRFNLRSPEEGFDQYVKGHIPGSVYFHLEKDLLGEVKDHGGRHPLPDMGQLKETLEEAGISRRTVVVAYDGGEGAMASRFWWLLTYMGHQNVYILNGGFNDWESSEYPVNREIPSYEKAQFNIELKPEIYASYEEVKAVVSGNNSEPVLIDSREKKRYLGIEEPIDKKAGRIPGAINKMWMEGFEQGKFKSIQEQKERFADIDKNKPVIVYCGSGITAGPNFMALKEAGYKNVKLYTGSFSDWISYEDNEIETGQ